MAAETPSLVPLGRGQLATARHLLPPERPGPMIAQHLLGTGNGSCLADRWPAPRALLVETGGNWTLAGDPGALDNTVSLRVAAKLGFRPQRHDRLLVADVPIPEPAEPPAQP